MISSVIFEIRLHLIVLIFIVHSNHIFAQRPLTHTIPIHVLDDRDGMKNLYNYYVFKDSEDFVWMSSRAGLHRYDGKNMKVYAPVQDDTNSLSANYLRSYFVEDSFSNIWFGSFRGLNCYLRSKDHFKAYQYSDTTAQYFLAGKDKKGLLWVLHLKKIFTFNPNNAKFTFVAHVLPRTRRIELTFDSTGEVRYISAYTRLPEQPGLQILEVDQKGKWHNRKYFDQTDGMTIRIRDVLPGNDSVVWIAIKDGIGKLNLKNKNLEIHNPLEKETPPGIESLEFENDSTILSSSTSGHYYRFNIYSNQFDVPYTKYYKKGDNSSLFPQAIYRDKDDGIWLSFSDAGVGYFHPTNLKFKHFSLHSSNQSQKENIYVNGINELPDGQILVSTPKQGLFKINPNDEVAHNLQFNNKQEIPFPRIAIKHTFIDSKYRVWFLAHGDFYVWYPNNSYTRITQPKGLILRNICELHSGEILISTLKGIYTLQDSAGLIDPKLIINTHFERREYGYIVVHENGLLYVPEGINQLNCYDPKQNFKLVNSIPIDFQVNDLTAISGSDDFLLATNRGAYHYNATTNKLQLLEWNVCGYNDLIFSIVSIAKNEYLLSSNNGICHINLSTKKSSRFSTAHGTGSTMFHRFSTKKHSNGSVWFGSNHGVTVYQGSTISKKATLSKVNIINLFVNDKKIPSGDHSISGDERHQFGELTTSFKNNTVAVSMAALDYTGRGKSVYEYRLLGYEDDWVNNENLGYVRYPNLPPGNYTFQARVTQHPETTTTSNWQIRAPLYMRPFFWIALLALLSLLLYKWMKIRQHRSQRLQQLKFENRLAIEKERVRIATDMHDDIGSGLSSLNMQLGMLANSLADSNLRNTLNTIAKSSHTLSEKIREIIWTVNAQNDFLENLMTKLHQYAIEFFEHHETVCRIDLSEDISLLKIPGHHRRELFLSYKEALHNISKHAHASTVQIKIYIKNNILIISIKDNGIGFDTNATIDVGTGLRSMVERMGRIDGQMTIKSDHTGTDLRIIYPISG